MPLRIGDAAPDFTLRSSDGRNVTLSSFRGAQNVVLIFYPKQLCTASVDSAAFASVGAAVFGVNGDGAASHERFIAKYGLTMPLLIDPGLSVAKAYDAVAGFGPIKIVNRTVVGIDRVGRIAFYQRGMPDTATILAALVSP